MLALLVVIRSALLLTSTVAVPLSLLALASLGTATVAVLATPLASVLGVATN